MFAKKVFRLFEPFRKFRKNAEIKNFFCKKTIWVSKNEEFYADFESAGDGLKSSIRKKLFTKCVENMHFYCFLMFVTFVLLITFVCAFF